MKYDKSIDSKDVQSVKICGISTNNGAFTFDKLTNFNDLQLKNVRDKYLILDKCLFDKSIDSNEVQL